MVGQGAKDSVTGKARRPLGTPPGAALGARAVERLT